MFHKRWVPWMLVCLFFAWLLADFGEWGFARYDYLNAWNRPIPRLVIAGLWAEFPGLWLWRRFDPSLAHLPFAILIWILNCGIWFLLLYLPLSLVLKLSERHRG